MFNTHIYIYIYHIFNTYNIKKTVIRYIYNRGVFCWFQVLWQHFMLLSFCIHLHAFSFSVHSFACIFLSFCIQFPFTFLSCYFHLYSCPFIFLPYSFHVQSNVNSFPFIFLSFACMFLSFAFISFHFLSKVMEMVRF